MGVDGIGEVGDRASEGQAAVKRYVHNLCIGAMIVI